MKGYEITFILDPNTGEEAQEAVIDKFKSTIGDSGGEVVHQATWGRRKLAYLVKKQEYGIYHLFFTTHTKEALEGAENLFRFSPEVIKWQTIAIEDVDQEHANFERLKADGTMAQSISDRGR